jgi:hypothetical protein
VGVFWENAGSRGLLLGWGFGEKCCVLRVEIFLVLVFVVGEECCVLRVEIFLVLVFVVRLLKSGLGSWSGY